MLWWQLEDCFARLIKIKARFYTGGISPASQLQEIVMLKIVAAGMTALFVTASSLAYAQEPSARTGERLNAADLGRLTEMRTNIVKAALQLTPDQEKYWPVVENAIRNRAKDRQARVAAAAARVNELRDRSPIEVIRDRDPVAFLQRRAEALTQRGTDLKKLADAWQPLYQTLSPDQRRRMAALTIFVLREMRNAGEQRRLQSADDDDE
jgi:LTXXQ motif family protein